MRNDVLCIGDVGSILDGRKKKGMKERQRKRELRDWVRGVRLRVLGNWWVIPSSSGFCSAVCLYSVNGLGTRNFDL